MQIDSIKKNFTKRYVIAVALIAILSTFTFYILHLTLKIADSTALIVNMSGKQRMLSQRITSQAQHYYQHLHNGEERDTQRAHIFLNESIEEMKNANDRLSSGRINETLTLSLSPSLQSIYFGKTDLKNRVDHYLSLASQITMSTDQERINHLVHKLVLESDSLLVDLNRAVAQYEKEGDETIGLIQDIKLAAWILTLFTLLLEVIFIFQPMIHRINELFKELTWKEEHLEYEIERRTHSLEESNYKLQHLASHDPMTGLKNRLNMEKDLENLINHYRQHHIPFAVAMIDIDWFKKINDNYGHDAGDTILKGLSSLIMENIRAEDSAYRAGGEEFVIIFNRIEEQTVIEKINTLRQLVEEYPFHCAEEVLNITISGGVYHPKWMRADTVQSILKLTDESLYEAKRSGRNKIVTVKDSLVTAPHPSTLLKILIVVERNGPFKIVYADFDVIDILGYTSEYLMSGDFGWDALLYKDDIDFLDKLTEMKPFMSTLRIYHPLGYVKIIKVECTFSENAWKIEIEDPIALAKSVEDKMIVYNFEAMMNNSDDFIYFKDRYHVFTAGSQTLVMLTNVSKKEDLVGKTDYEVFPQDYADKYFKLEKEVFSGEIEVAYELQPILDNNGQMGWVDNRKYPIKNNEGEIIGLFGIARRVSEPNSIEDDNDV